MESVLSSVNLKGTTDINQTNKQGHITLSNQVITVMNGNVMRLITVPSSLHDGVVFAHFSAAALVLQEKLFSQLLEDESDINLPLEKRGCGSTCFEATGGLFRKRVHLSLHVYTTARCKKQKGGGRAWRKTPITSNSPSQSTSSSETLPVAMGGGHEGFQLLLPSDL